MGPICTNLYIHIIYTYTHIWVYRILPSIYFQRDLSSTREMQARVPRFGRSLLRSTFNEIYFQRIYFQRDLLSTRDSKMRGAIYFQRDLLSTRNLEVYKLVQMGPTFVSYFVISQGVGSHHRCCLPPQDRQ